MSVIFFCSEFLWHLSYKCKFFIFILHIYTHKNIHTHIHTNAYDDADLGGTYIYTHKINCFEICNNFVSLEIINVEFWINIKTEKMFKYKIWSCYEIPFCWLFFFYQWHYIHENYYETRTIIFYACFLFFNTKRNFYFNFDRFLNNKKVKALIFLKKKKFKLQF